MRRGSSFACLALLVPATAWCADVPIRPLTLNPIALDAALAKQKPPEEFAGVTKKAELKTHYFLPTGFTFPARLENAIFSYNVETPAIAVVERNVEYLNRFVIPAGTKVIGTVAVQQSHDRVLINFQTMVFPSGDEVHFPALALSLDESAGIKGKVETHKDSAVANTVLRSLVSGTQTALMATGVSPIAAGAAQGLGGEATSALDTQRQQVVTTSVSVDAETPIRIYLPQRVEY